MGKLNEKIYRHLNPTSSALTHKIYSGHKVFTVYQIGAVQILSEPKNVHFLSDPGVPGVRSMGPVCE